MCAYSVVLVARGSMDFSKDRLLGDLKLVYTSVSDLIQSAGTYQHPKLYSVKRG